MSRSLRKTPIFGHTTARSEADDKRLWHKRWRARGREQLAALEPHGDPLSVHRHTVSSTWDMAKDGKAWFSPQGQREAAERAGKSRDRPEPERTTLTARLLARWRAK